MSLRGLILLAVAAALLVTLSGAHAASRMPAHTLSPQAVVTSYFGILNAGMKSGDFAALARVYAPDATLTQSNSMGVTTVAHSLAAITRFYQALQAKLPGFQWTRDSMRKLAPTIVLTYEHAGSPPLRVPGRCAHLFVITNGKITSLDWVTFFPGKK